MKCSSCGKCKSCARKDSVKKYAKGGLKQWFNEKWTKPDGSECGSDKGKDDAKCRPSKRVAGSTPVTWGEMSKSQRKTAISKKNKANKQGKYKSDYRLSKKK